MAASLLVPQPRLRLPLPITPSPASLPRRLPCTPRALIAPIPFPQLAIAAFSIAQFASLSAQRLASSILSFSPPPSVSPLCFAALSLSPPFAAISRSTANVNTPLTVVASGMAKWLELYSGVLMVRVLLSWFPNIPWERQPLQAIRDMCDPYLNLFRNIIPPLFNALDLSPLLAFLVLGMLASILNTTIQA